MEQFSAQTLLNVLRKHYPEELVEHPTSRKYLRLLLRSKFKTIPFDELRDEQRAIEQRYHDRLIIVKKNMLDWVRNQTDVTLWKAKNPIEYYRDSAHLFNYEKFEAKVVKVCDEYIELEGGDRLPIDVNRRCWQQYSMYSKMYVEFPKKCGS